MKDVATSAKPLDKGAALLILLRGLKLEGVEKSFKMAEHSLLPDRYLVGIHKADISPATLFSICQKMGMPDRFRPAFNAHAEQANAIHFGYEGQDGSSIYKVYLEFAAQLADSPSPVILLHVAYKWDVRNPGECMVARYECHQGLPSAAILDRIGNLYSGHPDPVAIGTVREIIGLAARRMKEPPMYLEVREENNPRASFDVNLHEAGVRVQEIAPQLARLREHYSIPAGRYDSLYDGIKSAVLGHLSGGISRQGKDFITVYYPVGEP